MAEMAWAARLNEDNYQAIASEKPAFDLDSTRVWVEQHGGGFFVRDPDNRKYDCQYLTDEVFHQIYAFENFDPNSVFHKLVRI
jgi:hypothetical protein